MVELGGVHVEGDFQFGPRNSSRRGLAVSYVEVSLSCSS